jgi:hypothetical protein
MTAVVENLADGVAEDLAVLLLDDEGFCNPLFIEKAKGSFIAGLEAAQLDFASSAVKAEGGGYGLDGRIGHGIN